MVTIVAVIRIFEVSEGGVEIERTPLDQIACVIVHAHGTTWSTSFLTELADRGVSVILCGFYYVSWFVFMPLNDTMRRVVGSGRNGDVWILNFTDDIIVILFIF